MADTNATILIPDISGFTEFMTNTELSHGSRAINILLDSIIKAVGDEYEVSEIEGDAILMFRRGPAPTKKEILDICLKIFNSFHYQKRWMEMHNVCPCGTCLAIVNLTLKFVVHHGPVGEMKVGRFITLSGTDIIVAHRLLKNSVPSNEYLLMTEKLCQHLPDSSERFEMEWSNLSDDFASIGKVDYRFALLNEARKNNPDPPEPQTNYPKDNTPYHELVIAANCREVYMIVMNIPDRADWWPGLVKVEQDMPVVYSGSIHHCSFEKYKAVISPLQMNLSDDAILYAESCQIEEMNLSLVYEYIFKKINENETRLLCRILNSGDNPVPEEIKTALNNNLKLMAEKLRTVALETNNSFS
jgi:class 3 adenylate cyclase